MITAKECVDKSTGVGFAIDVIATARALRELAQALLDGHVTVESVRVQTLAKHDDWHTSLLRLKYYDRRPAVRP